MPRPQENAKKVLVADDDRTLRYAVSKLLSAAGYAVTSARDGGLSAQSSYHVERQR